MASLWGQPASSAPERGGSDNNRGLELRLGEMLQAQEHRIMSRMSSIESSLEHLKAQKPASLLTPTNTFRPPSPEPDISARLLVSEESSGPPPIRKTVSIEAPSEDASIEMRLRRLGTLTVHIKRADDLIKADFRGLSDPYVVLKVPGQQLRRSTTLKNTLTPYWDEKFEYECVLEMVVERSMTIEVYDEDFSVTALIGRACTSTKGGSSAKAHSHTKDDKLGRLSSVKLDGLIDSNIVEFDAIPLEGVKSGTITFALEWNETVQSDSRIHTLVDRDPEIRAILKDVRRQMDSNAAREAREHASLQLSGLGPTSGALLAGIGGRRASFFQGTSKALTGGSPSSSKPEASNGSGAGAGAGASAGAAGGSGAAAAEEAEEAVTAYLKAERQSTDHFLEHEPELTCCGSPGLHKCVVYLFGPVLHPDGRFRSMWNVALAFFIMYCGIAVPLEIAFDADMSVAMCDQGAHKRQLLRQNCEPYLVWFYLNMVIDLWFIIDIVINFRTGFVQEGHFVETDERAASNYLKGSFAIDFVGSFPLNLVLMAINPDNIYNDPLLMTRDDIDDNSSAGRLNRLLRLMRLAKLAKLARMAKLRKYLENFDSFLNPATIALLKVVLTSVFCCHWLGCLWWLISDLELSHDFDASPWFDEAYGGANSWQTPMWLKNTKDFSLKYSHAFFWGAGMMTAMVPRDIEPVTTLEAYITTMTMFVGLLFNAYVISSLTAALTSMNSKKELAGKQLDTIRNYLLVKSVPADLRGRILEYYEYLLTSSQSLGKAIKFDQMPPNLAAQLALSINRKLAARCSFFRDVSNACIVTLISALQPAIFVPGQLIVFEGHPLTTIYFINRGNVQLLERTVPLRTLRDNDSFGLEDYAIAVESSKAPVVRSTAKALGYCDVMTLMLERLTQAVADDQDYMQRQMMRRAPAGAETLKTRGGGLGRIGGIGGKSRLRRLKRSSTQALSRSGLETPPLGGACARSVTPPKQATLSHAHSTSDLNA